MVFVKLEEILDEWEKDSKIDSSALDTESLNIPFLHHKYIKMFSTENLLYKKMKYEKTQLELKKFEYYSGKMDVDTLKEEGWEQFPLKILKPDVPLYINADPDLQKHILKLEYQNEKLDLLKSILSTINNRSFQISNAIKWNAFLAGQ